MPELTLALKGSCCIAKTEMHPLPKDESKITASTTRKRIISRMHEAVAHITAYCDMCKQADEVEMKKIESTLSAVLFDIHSLFGVVKEESVLQDVAESIANLSDVIEALCLFVTCAFEMLGNQGLSQRMVGCLLSVEFWFWDCCQESDLFCDTLSQKGMLLHFFYQLGELRKNSTCIEAVHELMLNSIGVLNSFAMRNKYHDQFF